MPARPASATRRTTLGGVLVGALALSGCDLGDLDPRDDPTTAGGPATGTSGSTGTSRDPDADLVQDVLAETDELIGLVTAARDAWPGLRAPLAPLLAMHVAHRTALDGPTQGASRATVPATAAATARLVRTRERRAQRRFVGAARSADSGALARLLASMSAAVAQQLVGLSVPGNRP